MDGGGIYGIVSLTLAFFFGITISKGIMKSIEHSAHASAALTGSRRERILLHLKRMAKPFLPLSGRLLSVHKVGRSAKDAVAMLDENGIRIQEDEFICILLTLSVAAGVIGGILTCSFAFAAALICIVFLGVLGVVKNRAEKRNLKMREEIPEALRAMATCFRSGQSLLQTMRHVSNEIDPPLGKLFSIAADRLEMGGSASEALSVMQSGSSVPELSFIAIALDVQHQTGGSVAPVLESARDAVENDLDLIRSLRVQTAQAKLSANIVTLMPFILVALFSIMSPDFLSPFFGSVLGMFLLGLAIVMQLAGVLAVRRMLKVEL